jgi:hypothetical protein
MFRRSAIMLSFAGRDVQRTFVPAIYALSLRCREERAFV